MPRVGLPTRTVLINGLCSARTCSATAAAIVALLKSKNTRSGFDTRWPAYVVSSLSSTVTRSPFGKPVRVTPRTTTDGPAGGGVGVGAGVAATDGGVTAGGGSCGDAGFGAGAAAASASTRAEACLASAPG